ncbi:MAG: hypothetical protein M3O35_03455 [Acidobacteriota bacterium]|nr:hypothetical protein [Acidobacteriota bacterium]
MRGLCWLLLLAPLAADELSPDEEAQAKLAKVRRIYVDILTGGAPALQLRDLIITSVQNSRLFILTEEEDKADAVLKGAADEKVFTDLFTSSESLNAHSTSGSGTGATTSRTSGGHQYAGFGVGENETHRTEERKHEAVATVRLVDKEGDVIWSTTQESLGGKFVGAGADVANKIAKKLAVDYKRASDDKPTRKPAKPAFPLILV